MKSQRLEIKSPWISTEYLVASHTWLSVEMSSGGLKADGLSFKVFDKTTIDSWYETVSISLDHSVPIFQVSLLTKS